MKNKNSLLTGAALTISALSLSAQTVIYDFDYDGNNPSSATAGSALNQSYSITADGVGGTNAGNATFDSTSDSGSFSFGHTISNGRNGSIADSTNASDYILTFDVKAIGLLDGQSISGQAQLSFNFSDQITANASNAINITDTFQTYTLNLGSDFNTAATINLTNINNNMQFRIDDFSAHDHFGYDTGNSIIFDNVSLTQVPEPATYAALTGLLALGFVMIRRRS
ncbi:PEP-CTERM sorting domain-containing protein [Coraliomargarita sp. W4R53]